MTHDDRLRDALLDFSQHARTARRANPGHGQGTGLELLLAPLFAQLVREVLAIGSIDPPSVLPEYARSGIGRPDLALARPNTPARAFIELKQPGHDLLPRKLQGHDKRQFARFCELPLWAYCNFHVIHLYARAELIEEAVVIPAASLDPATPDAQARRLIASHAATGFAAIIDRLRLAQPVPPRTAVEMAQVLAHAARLVREVVVDLCRDGAPPALAAVRSEFNQTLFAHPAAGGYDTSDEIALFANAFAQTLTFGLLLARQEKGGDVDANAYRALPVQPYPLLRATLRALTQDEVVEALGVAFDVILDTVNTVDPALLIPARRARPDPVFL